MEDRDLIPRDDVTLQTVKAVQQVAQMASAIQTIADLMRVQSERMAALEKKVAMLEKVAPAQATELNKRIRDRASALCTAYRVPMDQSGRAAAAIRKYIQGETGARCIREVARCDYPTVCNMIATYDNSQLMRQLKKGIKT